jgi:hypothetical protein
MAAKGLGVLYERGHDGTRIRRPLDPARRQWYLDRWYRPHHQRLTDAADAALARAGRVGLAQGQGRLGHPERAKSEQTPAPIAV